MAFYAGQAGGVLRGTSIGGIVKAVGSGSPKLDWRDLPIDLRTRVETAVAGQVVGSVVQRSGFSPAATVRLLLADERWVFLKAASRQINERTVGMYRQEADINAGLADVPGVPKLLDVIEDDPWVALLFQDIDGRMPVEPWSEDDLDKVLHALADLHAVVTPSPVKNLPLAIPGLRELFQGWPLLSESPERARRLKSPWDHDDVQRLLDLQSGWEEVAVGDTLLHMDLRADNVLLTDERVWFVDWTHSMIGAAAVDVLVMLPSVAATGDVSLGQLLERSSTSRMLPFDSVVAFYAALSGFFIEHSLRPPDPTVPTVREFQAQQGYAILDWLRAM